MLPWIKKIVTFYFISLLIVFLRLALSPLKLSFKGVEQSLIMNSLVLTMGMISVYLILKSFHTNNYKISVWSSMEKIGIIIVIIMIFNMFFPFPLFSFKYSYILLHTLNLIMIVFGIILTLHNKKETAVSFLLCGFAFLINVYLNSYIIMGEWSM